MEIYKTYWVYFVLDNVMFWEAFRWERLDTGHIYIQKFPKGKMYTGQTIDIGDRFKLYNRLRGSNPHHTRALVKYGLDTIKVALTSCPKYLLDNVEIFVIDFFNLTDPRKGYNKTTGGRKGYRVTKETRMRMSLSRTGEKNHNFGKTRLEETRMKISIAQIGENNHNFGKTPSEETRAKISKTLKERTLAPEARSRVYFSRTGEHSHMFGKHLTEETRAKISEKMLGKKHKDETRQKMSDTRKGDKNPMAKPICVFGKLYGTASEASNILCEVCDTSDKGNFMVKWARKPQHQNNVFYISKKFYDTMKEFTQCITRDMYDDWSNRISHG
ncbi:GIY-YIG catalytic domain-containing endonuclease [Acanthocystis turfacea Chlorella virus NTS-1]|nr:GIY-YIG catalytic domain-containing endonuclease [Acanthocystis turfacea Chlorella virus NTS-1]